MNTEAPHSPRSDWNYRLFEEEEKAPSEEPSNTPSLWQRTWPTVRSSFESFKARCSNALETLRISSAASQCIKSLSTPSRKSSYPIWSIYLQSREQRDLAAWAEAISTRHARSHQCPSYQECPSFKELYQRDLRQIARHSEMARSLLKNDAIPLHEKMRREEARVQHLFRLYVETVFEPFVPSSESAVAMEEKGDFPPAQSVLNAKAFHRKLLQTARSIAHLFDKKLEEHWKFLAIAYLVNVSDCMLKKLMFCKYTGIAKDFSWAKPDQKDALHTLHPFIMEKLDELAQSLPLFGNALGNLNSMSFQAWVDVAKNYDKDWTYLHSAIEANRGHSH